jgi:hypothetical protein
LQNNPEHDRMCTVKDGWLACPVCRRNRRLLHVLPETQATCLEVYCKTCKTAVQVNIARGQSVERRSP